jgi:beta-N-acetylhexosaminidase
MRQAYRPFEARNVLLLTLVIYLLVGCGAFGERHSTSGKDQNASGDRENTVASKVSGMSLRDTVGQMFVISVGGTEPDYYIEKMVRKRNIGDMHTPRWKNSRLLLPCVADRE